MPRTMMRTILTRNKKKIAECNGRVHTRFKEPNENDENNEKNNYFDENYKNLLSVIAFMKHKA